jgi:ApbE superfamily uncharacterized protein (UPF0280 family)
MRDPVIIRLLPDQRRLHLNDGPIDLILEATGTRGAVHCAYEAAARRFVTILDELCAELPLLRTRAGAASPPGGSIARAMAAAVAPFCEDNFITPMAAVAGAVAEAVLVAMTTAAELDRAYVNNGGDIALFLAEGQRYTIGMVERPDRPSLFGSFEVSAAMPVRGVATSGWRGRSFSLGIADAVTVLAETASKADAAATILANAVDLPDHPAITRVPACEIAPDSDLKELPVTRSVGSLSRHEIAQALAAGEALGRQLQREGLIYAAALSLQGSVRVVSPPGPCFALHDTSRSLIHA